MSIALTAYPMAFLISPAEVTNEKLRSASENKVVNKNVATKNLKTVTVLTNLTNSEFNRVFPSIEYRESSPNNFVLSSGITVRKEVNGNFCRLVLSGNGDSKVLQYEGEYLFSQLDKLAGRNVRIIDSAEYFYYGYSTEYTKITEIYEVLKKQGATGIFTTDDDEIVADLNGQNVRYYKTKDSKCYKLEVEQKIKILNIGVRGAFEGTNVQFGLTALKIKTNIRPAELRDFLSSANYLYDTANDTTPLKNSDATLHWVLKNGTYTAEFSGNNNSAIIKEAEILFRKMNTAAGRDLRFINDLSTAVYTYPTNYTDKGILINTLTEHGAEEIEENGDEVTCKLFGMEMVYYKKDGSDGYTLDITQVSDKSRCEEVLSDLSDEYALNIQDMTYNKIKERLAAENLRLESEVVEDDNSIVLTIEV